jgi:hypothetical protein
MVMHTKKIMMALFAIVIASSLIVVSSFVSSAFADTKKVTNPLSYLSFPITVGGHKSSSPVSQSANGGDSTDNTPPTVLREDKSNSPMSQSANAGDSSGVSGDTNSVSTKDLKSLSKCQSGAAADGDLTLAEVKGCYSQVF